MSRGRTFPEIVLLALATIRNTIIIGDVNGTRIKKRKGETMATATITCECWKCGGTGYIAAFSGIANGTCFKCNGSGKLTGKAAKPKPVKPLTEWQRQQVDLIEKGELSGLSFGKLSELRNFAHWPLPQVPNLLATWKQRGEEHFQAAQDVAWHENHARIMAGWAR